MQRYNIFYWRMCITVHKCYPDEDRIGQSDGIRIGQSDEVRIGQSDEVRIGQSDAI